MVDVAKHIRIFDKQPSDDLVDKRSIIVSAMAEKILKFKSYEDHFSLVEDIAKALESEEFPLPAKRAGEVEEAIQAQSSAFTREGQPLQMITCLMLAVLKTIDGSQISTNGWGKPELLASAVWLGLSLQKPCVETRMEALRSELLNTSRDFVAKASDMSRKRIIVPDPTVKIADLTDATKVADSIGKGLSKSIESLRQNAALDREELDLLWWTLSDWSTIQGQPFSRLDVRVAAITAGIEGAALLRRLPSVGHKQLILRHVKDDEILAIAMLMESLREKKQAISASVPQSQIAKAYPRVFSLLSGLFGELSAGESLGLRDWGARAMLEATVLRFSQNSALVL